MCVIDINGNGPIKNRRLDPFNEAEREHLYFELSNLVKRKTSLSSYEKYHVIHLVENKIREGKL